jgi:hypothetical protein
MDTQRRWAMVTSTSTALGIEFARDSLSCARQC